MEENSFFIGEPRKEMNLVTNADTLVKSAPRLEERFDAIAELRTIDDGTLYKGNEFRRVASIVAPLIEVQHILEPDFLRNKRKFYTWLDDNPEYCTYDRRAARARTSKAFHGWRTDGTDDQGTAGPEPASE
jgi:hypothetical protein